MLISSFIKKLSIIICFIFAHAIAFSQISTLRDDIEHIIAGKKIKVGISLFDLSSSDTLSINGNNRFPLQSVFKLHLCMAILDKVDKNELSLTDSISFSKSELYDHIWSPIQKAYPQPAIMPLSKVIEYTIMQSDNSGCDKLLTIIGGAKKLNNYIHDIGLEQTNIENNELELQSSWDKQFRNYSTPNASIELLKLINNSSLLNDKSNDFLLKTMESTSTGSIRNKLPKEANIAYKTGTSGQNKQGITAATNNIGIITLPNNRKIAYAIFITDSRESKETNLSIIADIGVILYNLQTQPL